jgi:hypothetical protein
VHLEIEQTQNDMTSGHIVTAVHDQWRLLGGPNLCPNLKIFRSGSFACHDQRPVDLGGGASGSSPESGILPWLIGVAFLSILFINTIEYLKSRSSVKK